MAISNFLINYSDQILVTGSNGFIGSKVVQKLLEAGFTNIRCLVRLSSNLTALKKVVDSHNNEDVHIIKGNLLSPDDCRKITENVSVIYHLAAGRGEKSYPDAFMNSVITTRNLLDAVLKIENFKRFVNVSSFTVYSNSKIPPGGLLNESCPIETHPELRGEAYCYAKVRQDELLIQYNKDYNIPYVILRPGVVYGPGNKGITGRVGIKTFGIFLHLGGSNKIPLSYVENCADAIVLAGIRTGIENEIFNVVDDHLPTSKEMLNMYKKNVGHFKSIYLPNKISYVLCYLWEKYSKWSHGQLPAVFNRKVWASAWKGNEYSNDKLKQMLGWSPKVCFENATKSYFDYEKGIMDEKS